MDTSKEYILMCEKATEIQKIFNKRSLEENDFINREKKDPKREGFIIIIWLPRQDQLQEMIIGKTTYADLEEQFNNTLNTWFEISYNFDPKIDEKLDMAHWSMEQLWLAFVMVEKYNKIWNGKDWIKKNT